MTRNGLLCGASALGVLLGLALAGPAAAQGEASEVSEVVVTGSYIQGTPEDAALPVDVISAEDIQKQGSPTTLELVKQLTVSSGVLGDTNQFDTRAQGSEGSGTVNLRGLGAARTLVLMNGRRITANPFTGVPDTNSIPSAAIGRVEVLKDGAAAVYGSDAIAGVVNFITRSGFEGLEVGGSWSFVDGSKDDYTATALWGWQGERANILIAGGYQHRSELTTTDRDWAVRPYTESLEGGWSGGSPVAPFLPVFNPAPGVFAPAAGFVLDSGCAALGGVPLGGALPACNFQYTPFDNLTERENRFQIYGEVNYDVTDTITFHAEGLYAKTDVPEWNTSPGYLALQTPTSATNPATGLPAAVLQGYFVPSTNPGYQLYATQNPGAIPAFATGVHIPGVRYRPFGFTGNPIFDNGPSIGERTYESFRVSAGLKGEVSEAFRWDLAVTYGEQKATRTGYDTIVSRFQLALRGLGGEGCNPTTGTPGVGSCKWFNPFSNAQQTNAITGQTNPGFNAAVANDPALVSWFFQKLSTEQETSLLVIDAVVSGETGIELPGGAVAWAFGAQFRKDEFSSDYADINNQLVNPCVDTPLNGSTSCAVKGGPFMFLGVATPADLDGDVKAVLGELSLPIFDSLQVSLAARYEDYGGAVGSTFDPKVSARWAVTDWLAFRGSAGSTFRGPPQTNLDPSSVTGFNFIAGSFRAYDIIGNPNLEPESAKTYSVGAILDVGNFRATVDWWQYDFSNPIVVEPSLAIVNTMFPGGATTRCSDPVYAALLTRFVLQAPCATAGLAGIARVRTFVVNGPPVKTSGFDVLANMDFDDVMGGDLRFGASLTYTLEYKVGAFTVEGVVVEPAFEAANYLNYQRSATALPEFKFSGFAEYTRGGHNLRWTVNFVDSYIDQRTAILAPNPVSGQINTKGTKLKDFVTHEIDYRVELPWDVTVTASVDNVFDEEPPFARLDLNYDPFTSSALGRVYKLGMKKRF
jgi:iron complex outermembrane recepter protein